VKVDWKHKEVGETKVLWVILPEEDRRNWAGSMWIVNLGKERMKVCSFLKKDRWRWWLI
jgi:hypothetical protein